jgi:hypothetical protein
MQTQTPAPLFKTGYSFCTTVYTPPGPYVSRILERQFTTTEVSSQGDTRLSSNTNHFSRGLLYIHAVSTGQKESQKNLTMTATQSPEMVGNRIQIVQASFFGLGWGGPTAEDILCQIEVS